MVDHNAKSNNINIKIPLYVSVYESIFEKIKTGAYKPGEKLPGENSLAKELNISRGTLRQALMLLQEDGIIHNWQGKGNFVTENFKKMDTGLEKVSFVPIAYSDSECEVSLQEVIFQPATEVVQKNLQLSHSKLVAVFHLNFIASNSISCHSVLFVSYDILNEANVSLDNQDQLKDFILTYIDRNVVNAHTEIRVVEAREQIAGQMAIEEGRALLCFYEIMYSGFEVPVIYSKSYFVPERYNFFINRRKL